MIKDILIYCLFILFFCVTLYYLLDALICFKKKRNEIKSWPDMSCNNFVKEMEKKYNIEESYIIKKRISLSRALWVPLDKIIPDLNLNSVASCFEQFTHTNKSDYIIDVLLEDIYYSHKYSSEEVQAINIETVSDYIYYSAILDGKIPVPNRQE